MKSMLNGTVYVCDTEEAYKETIDEKIDSGFNIIALTDDLSKIVMLPSITARKEDIDFNDDKVKGYKYYLCITALLANPEFSKKLDDLINEYVDSVILNTENSVG